MASAVADERFTAAMRRLTELHADAILLRACAEVAERAFAEALRTGDLVRRAARQGRRDRPDEEDCRVVEEAARRIDGALGEAALRPEVAELRDAAAAGDGARAAALACRVFAGLEAIQPAPAFGYRPVALRERRRGGETLPAPAELAARVARRALEDLVADPDDRELGTSAVAPARGAIPRPVVLSPSLAASGSELALRVPLAAIAGAVLRHADSGDLWVLARRVPAPRAVALLSGADDEWWAASPVPYDRYAAELTSALRRAGVTVAIEDENGATRDS